MCYRHSRQSRRTGPVRKVVGNPFDHNRLREFQSLELNVSVLVFKVEPPMNRSPLQSYLKRTHRSSRCPSARSRDGRKAGRQYRVLIRILRRRRNIEPALVRQVQVPQRHIRRIHIFEAKITARVIRTQDNRVSLVTVRQVV